MLNKNPKLATEFLRCEEEQKGWTLNIQAITSARMQQETRDHEAYLARTWLSRQSKDFEDLTETFCELAQLCADVGWD
jgi:hypothetical protein